MEEEDQGQKKFVCKVCSKSFFSGRSLGGHMRCHLVTNSAKKHEDHHNGTTTTMDLEGGDDDCYGLRENPKKSWRVSDEKQSITAIQENHCKQCGKEFPSVRALSGHMRCHSIKSRIENVCKQCGKGFSSMKALFGHMRHHSKRSRVESQSDHQSTLRYKINGNLHLPNLNASCSYVSEIDEVEEAAMCLMMLSRDVRNRVEFDSVMEASENFAVPFEAKALHQSKDDDDTRKIKKPRKKLDSCLSCSGNSLFEKNESEFGDLDSGFMSKNEKNFELGLSIEGFHKGDESKNTEANSKIECCNENSVEQIQTLKNKDYDCPICFKVFPSGQAMGGHKRAHYIGILSENKNKESVLAKQEFPNIQNVFDLNLQVTLENEINDDDGVAFKPWWVGSDHEPEPLVISN
ncbi:zinc finger protein 878-like [Camellia sinensis]|uniref:C2H2-type domain-containing protein n=1 Tax=Camellia sinensis var. sinensis TaxID=542762 RepID=A0A4S4EAB3_CAMSN|nr:zinc finger protein 878-like [Camellia sinensis]THG13109.1 hypothetical protein TEA_011689 [Camellia sinensis var. sinensis]